MRSVRILSAIGLCLCLSGCRLAFDAAHNMVFETCLFANDVKGKVYYPMLASSAWTSYCVHHGGKYCSKDFACGFKEGYADYLENGGNGTSHPLPPIRYWKIHKETPEGRKATERWLAGFREGAAVAQTSGKRELIVVPVGGEPVAPPIGPPPAPPHPDMLPPAEPTDPLPPPRRLPSAPHKAAGSRIEPTAADSGSPKSLGQTGGSGGQSKEVNDLPRIVTGRKPTAPPSAAKIPWPPRNQTPCLVSEVADSQGPKILGQTAGYSKEENDLPRIVTGSKPSAAPPSSEVPLPPRDKTPRSAEMQYQVAMVMLQAGATEKAVSWLYSALREDPTHVPSHKALMEYYQKTGDFLRAAEHRVKARRPAEGEADEK